MSDQSFTVSGPGVDVSVEGVGAAMSRALTAAQIPRSSVPASFYVRDDAGRVHVRVERDATGGAQVYTYVDGRGAGDVGEEHPAVALAASPPRRPGRSRPQPKENEMAGQKTRTRTTGGTKQKPAAAPVKIAGAAPETPADSPADEMLKEAKRVSAKQAAKKILEDEGSPLAASVIAERVIAHTGVELKGATPKATIAAMLSVENAKQDGLFVRVDKGTYDLRSRQDGKK